MSKDTHDLQPWRYKENSALRISIDEEMSEVFIYPEIGGVCRFDIASLNFVNMCVAFAKTNHTGVVATFPGGSISHHSEGWFEIVHVYPDEGSKTMVICAEDFT